MPWEKTFDVDEAVAAAMKLFWEKGYAQTSIADLVEATGVPRQSLYNAVGCKRELFIKTLLKYDIEQRRAAVTALETMAEPVTTIRMFFDHAVQEATANGDSLGCFLINTALDLRGHDEEVRTVVSGALSDLEGFFLRLIERGQARSEVPKTLDARGAAKGLLALYMGLRMMARGGLADETLKHLPDQALALLR